MISCAISAPLMARVGVRSVVNDFSDIIDIVNLRELRNYTIMARGAKGGALQALAAEAR